MSNAAYHPFRARLDAEAARSIRARVRSGEAPRTIASEYGVALSTIYDVVAGRTYRPRVVVETDDATLVALTAIAAVSRQSLEAFIADSLRVIASAAKTT